MRIVHRRKAGAQSGSHELDRHLPFQRREWRAQQIGWLALGLFLAAALGGLFGGGPLSSARAATADGGLAVEYQRFVRAGAAQRLRFEIATPGAGPVELRLSRGYLDAVRVEHVLPSPASTSATPEWTTFVFAPGTRTVTVDGEATGPGRLILSAATGAGASLALWQLAYF
jgi:hypothetical protein